MLNCWIVKDFKSHEEDLPCDVWSDQLDLDRWLDGGLDRDVSKIIIEINISFSMI